MTFSTFSASHWVGSWHISSRGAAGCYITNMRKKVTNIWHWLMILHFWRLLTYNPDYQLIGGIVTPHQQGVIDDEVAGEEVGVAVYGSSQYGFTVGADVQRVVVDQLQEVLIQQNHLTALLPWVCLDVAVSQGAFEVKHLQRTCHS